MVGGFWYLLKVLKRLHIEVFRCALGIALWLRVLSWNSLAQHVAKPTTEQFKYSRRHWLLVFCFLSPGFAHAAGPLIVASLRFSCLVLFF